MQMLEEDPDTVKEVLSGLASNLYDSLNKKMGTTTLSSALTFYNDKEMASQLSDYKKEISNWESKLSDMEEKYHSLVRWKLHLQRYKASRIHCQVIWEAKNFSDCI